MKPNNVHEPPTMLALMAIEKERKGGLLKQKKDRARTEYARQGPDPSEKVANDQGNVTSGDRLMKQQFKVKLPTHA